ncbi:hypothetical protein [Neoroseomonas rubea]|uniref:hypothetical protein n=1 Tax=Neoroseomonas rubea TaxID=2748666 RepID=UPI0018DF523C|nr:hypothetical protein [Roseomonas rubea]
MSIMEKQNNPESRYDRIMRGQGRVFGPTLDAMVRDVDARVPPEASGAHREILESWPMAPDGQVIDAEALFDHLSALRVAPEAVPPHVGGGSSAKAAAGVILGALVGVPLGSLAYFIAHAALLPYAMRGSDAVMWFIIASVIGVCGAVGARQGWQPSRLGYALARAMLAFVLGAVVSAFVAAFVADALGSLFQVSRMEGAFAMGIVFTIMPAGGFLGGLLCAIWAGRHGWRRWRSS